MDQVKLAAEQLLAALDTVPDLRTHRDLSARIDPPAVVLGPPALTWDTVCREPSEATFIVFIVVAADERAIERLWTLNENVADAIDRDARDAAVRRTDPATYSTGGVELPAYAMQVDFALGGLQ